MVLEKLDYFSHLIQNGLKTSRCKSWSHKTSRRKQNTLVWVLVISFYASSVKGNKSKNKQICSLFQILWSDLFHWTQISIFWKPGKSLILICFKVTCDNGKSPISSFPWYFIKINGASSLSLGFYNTFKMKNF